MWSSDPSRGGWWEVWVEAAEASVQTIHFSILNGNRASFRLQMCSSHPRLGQECHWDLFLDLSFGVEEQTKLRRTPRVQENTVPTHAGQEAGLTGRTGTTYPAKPLDSGNLTLIGSSSVPQMVCLEESWWGISSREGPGAGTLRSR